jgi:hypothetical protein
VIPYEISVQRTRALLERQLSQGLLFRAWELELAYVLNVGVPDGPLDELSELWAAMTRDTPYPLGVGPWGQHPVWLEQSYGVGHVRSFVRLMTNSDRAVPGATALIDWLQSLFGTDGSCRAQAHFQGILASQYPELARQRDHDAGAAWQRALGKAEPTDLLWAHSDLEDAWATIDALSALDAAPANVDAIIRWLRSMQRPDGAFRAPLSLDAAGEPYADALHDTMWALRTLSLLGAQPADSDAAITWLLQASLPPAIEPQWARIEALGALGAARRLPPAALDRWDQLSFTENPRADLVDFEAYAAIRGHRWLVEAL